MLLTALTPSLKNNNAMQNNIFEEFQRKKLMVANLTKEAISFGWLNKNDGDEIIKRLDNDVLTLGVIGQMKCGKSTFLNAFVFEDDVLPSATTPMTAALSVITYGAEKKIEAEFYTRDEWADQKLNASKSTENVDEVTKSKIQSAQELVEKSRNLPGPVESFLGKTKADSFDNLIDYVGADGKFVSITKAVRIYYPKDYLKGVEIVDTPGFNDPIVSREERTKEFLHKADVVLLMLYAGRPFDATDRSILFKNVGQCGVGRVLIGINKYDIPYETGESEDEIVKYVVEQLENAAREERNDDINDILKKTNPIPLSANMALLSEMPMSKVERSGEYKYAYTRYCDIFEANGQGQLLAKSHIEKLIAAVREVIEKEKAEILIRKPVNRIKAAGQSKIDELAKSIEDKRQIVINCSKPDDELEEKLSTLQRAKRRLDKKIDSMACDIESEIRNAITKAGRQVEDSKDDAKALQNEIYSRGGFKRFFVGTTDGDIRELRAAESKYGRKVRDAIQSVCDECNKLVLKSVNAFLDDATDLLDRVEDFDSHAIVSQARNRVDFVVNVSTDQFGWNDESDAQIDKILDSVQSMKDNALAEVKDIIQKQGIDLLEEQLQEVLNDKAGREAKAKEAQAALDEVQTKLSTINGQMEKVKAIIAQ